MALELGLVGAAVGLLSFLIIGVLHPVVIKTEYHFGKRAWPVFAVAGAVALAGSLLCGDVVVSIIMGILSFSLFWSIKELYDQEERVRKGWYPDNPDRKHRTRPGRPVPRTCPSSRGTRRMSRPAIGTLKRPPNQKVTCAFRFATKNNAGRSWDSEGGYKQSPETPRAGPRKAGTGTLP